MSGVLLNQKKAKLIDQERSYLNGCELHLFTDNRTVTDADTDGNYTVPTDGAYTSKVINFGVATLNGANQGQLLGDTQTWTFNHDTGDFTIHGYFFKDPADGHVVLSENAGTPVTISAPGQTFSVTPKKLMTTG